jgi:hypothetical protein
MRGGIVLALLLAAGCVQTRDVNIHFGQNGQGLDGFMCKDPRDNQWLLEKNTDAGSRPVTLVFDFIDLGGDPSCRASELVDWCSTHACRTVPGFRQCRGPVQLPGKIALLAGGALDRTRNHQELLSRIDAAKTGQPLFIDTPNQTVLVRMVATTQSCDQLDKLGADGTYPEFGDRDNSVVGCAYSCPTRFDSAAQTNLYLGFDTLTASCASGVRTCATNALTWSP